MSIKEAYKKKIEAEVTLIEAKLTEFAAQANNSAADVRIKYAKLVSELEQGVATAKTKLKEISEAKDDAWEHLKEDMEHTWNALNTEIKNITAKFKS